MPGHRSVLTFTKSPRSDAEADAKSSSEQACLDKFAPLETDQTVAAVAQPPRAPILSSGGHPFSRCNEKGCIFPASRWAQGKCLHHNLQQLEPTFFQSFQPSMLLVDRAKFGAPHSRSEDVRARDRHRLAALRESFWEDVA